MLGLGASENLLRQDQLYSTGIKDLARRYREGKPYPHLVVDGLFNEEILQKILEEFDSVSSSQWVYYDTPREVKRGSRPDRGLPPLAQAYFDTLYSGPFVRALMAITGIPNLLTDPTLYGGGLHDIGPGGRFSVHADFQKHPRNGLSTRLVVITYLNADWRESYGGQLELWREGGTRCETSILPEFGRTVIMPTTLHTLHGHPRPVSAPDGRHRRSLAAYFYTNGVSDGEVGDNLTTVFADRASRADEFKWFLKRLTPPLVLDGVWSAVQFARRRMPAKSVS